MILEGKTLLILGGTGSMGRAFVRRALGGEAGSPRKVIVMSRDEGKQHAMRLAYETKRAVTDEVIYQNFRRVLEFRIGDVRNYADVASAVRNVDIVINAAALKQVPLCEYFPEQALLTNCSGAANIVRAIRELDLAVERYLREAESVLAERVESELRTLESRLDELTRRQESPGARA